MQDARDNTPPENQPPKDPPRDGTAADYVLRVAAALSRRYHGLLREIDPAAARLLDRKAEIAAGELKTRRMRDYAAFWDGLSEEEQATLASEDAKMAHLSRIARIIATSEVVRAHNRRPTTAGSLGFVLKRFREEGVTAGELQRFLDGSAVAWFSLTGHPTNPMTVAYTAAQTDVARIVGGMESQTDLRAALRALYDTPIVGPRKTPLSEAEETLNTLEVVYDTALRHRGLFEKALARHGYAEEGVAVRAPLIRPCAWTLGDGDGNPAMTAEVLEAGIVLHGRRIRARYRATLEAEGSAEALQLAKSLDGEDDAKALVARAEEAGLLDFAYLVKCFGLGFGTIDLRHNARDVMETVSALCGAIDPAFPSLDEAGKARRLAALLEDKAAISRLGQVKEGTLPETAARVLGRLRVIARHPGVCEKLIVAETAHPAHALSALLLLAVAGAEGVDVVTLSESVADLAALGGLVTTLLSEAAYRRHVEKQGHLIVMIAKSDTTRQDGRGEAEYAQYAAVADAFRAFIAMQEKHEGLKSARLSVMNGGGHALQRGGGRVTEVPAIHGWAAQEAGAEDMGPSTLTIQGQQQFILFCPGRTALGTLEALAAQNLYTRAGICGAITSLRHSKGVDKDRARADARLYARAAGEEFDAVARPGGALDRLLVAAPWLSMKAGNASSRPAKRGEAPVEPGVTPRAAKGENPRALAGRAISGERLTAHACLPVFSVLGLLRGMEAVRRDGCKGRYADPLHHLYRALKLHRDAARATLNAAQMADFDIAWPLLAGRGRPSKMEVARLARRFDPETSPPEVTLAFIEDYFLRVETMTYEMVSGQKTRRVLKHGEGLEKLWPELFRQTQARDRAAEFSRVIECLRARRFDEDPDTPLSERQFRITQALYTAANVVNAPVGILATRTRLEPVYELGATGRTRFMRPKSWEGEEVLHLLKFPEALR